MANQSSIPHVTSPKITISKKLGYVIAAVAGICGGPLGLLISPLVLYVCMKRNKTKDNPFLYWVGAGVAIASSLLFSSAIFSALISSSGSDLSKPISELNRDFYCTASDSEYLSSRYSPEEIKSHCESWFKDQAIAESKRQNAVSPPISERNRDFYCTAGNSGYFSSLYSPEEIKNYCESWFKDQAIAESKRQDVFAAVKAKEAEEETRKQQAEAARKQQAECNTFTCQIREAKEQKRKCISMGFGSEVCSIPLNEIRAEQQRRANMGLPVDGLGL